MNASKLNLLVRKTITPKATSASLMMCLMAVAKDSVDDAYTYYREICKHNIVMALSMTDRMIAEMAERCRKIAKEELAMHCSDPKGVSASDVLGILEINDQELFQQVVSALSQPMIQTVFKEASCQNACRMMEMCICYVSGEVLLFCKNAFSEFMGRYETRGQQAMQALLALAVEKNEVYVLSVIIRALGVQQVKSLYGPGWDEEVDRLIVSGYESSELWDSYFEGLFSRNPSPEEVLRDGLWYVQLFAEDENDVAAKFYLYASARMGVDHEIFAYTDSFQRPDAFSAKHQRLYQDQIELLWDNPEKLSDFLDRTTLCNPFAEWQVSLEGYSLLQGVHGGNFREYDVMDRVFARGTDCGTILNIYFKTEMKKTLPMEDVLHLASRYDALPSLLEELKKYPLRGVPTKYKAGTVVFYPRCYYTLSLHLLRVSYAELERLMGTKNRLRDKQIAYVITGYENGQIRMALSERVQEEAQGETDGDQWEEAVSLLETALSRTKKDIPRTVKKNSALRSFSVNCFVEQYDLNLLTKLITANTDRLSEFKGLFTRAKWNSIFRVADASVPGHLYRDLAKYRPCTITMFRELFSQGLECTKIVEFYLSSIYKVILPINIFLTLGKEEEMRLAFSRQIVFGRIREGSNSQCRLLNIVCDPVCEVEEAEGKTEEKVIPLKCIDFTLSDGMIVKILFRNLSKRRLSAQEQGALFGYLARNEHLGIKKQEDISRLPKIDRLNFRELLFILNCMEKAVLLRRFSNEELMKLLQTMGDNNPFSFRSSIRLVINYYRRIYKPSKVESMASAMATMLLNAEDAETIVQIYLDTMVKHYVCLDDFVAAVKARRTDCLEDLMELLSDIEFMCAVDHAGYLWSPYLRQNAVYVGTGYGGMLVSCRMQFSASGSVSAQVISAEAGGQALKQFLLSLLRGYAVNDGLLSTLRCAAEEGWLITPADRGIEELIRDRQTVLQALLFSVGEMEGIREWKDQDVSQMRSDMDRLIQFILDGEFVCKKLAHEVHKIINKYYDALDKKEMETALSELSQVLMEQTEDSTLVTSLLYRTFQVYSFYYKDNTLVHIWVDQLRRFYGPQVGDAFQTRIQATKKYKKNE